MERWEGTIYSRRVPNTLGLGAALLRSQRKGKPRRSVVRGTGYMTRTLEEWKKEVDQDVRLIVNYLREAERDKDKALRLALALKEARRLQSDIYRIGSEVYGIDREEIDRQGPL